MTKRMRKASHLSKEKLTILSGMKTVDKDEAIFMMAPILEIRTSCSL